MLNMEMTQQKEININFAESKYTEDYLRSIITLAFAYYDHHHDKERYESGIENTITSFAEQIKPMEIKMQLKYLIDFIGKYSTADTKFIESSLRSIQLSEEFISTFKVMLGKYNEHVELMKQAIIEKASNQRIKDFKYSFNVKYCDSLSDKVSFVIKIIMIYLDDNEVEKKIEIDLSLNQFYHILNELQKIDTMIKTLI